jgi:hypothetical protein
VERKSKNRGGIAIPINFNMLVSRNSWLKMA